MACAGPFYAALRAFLAEQYLAAGLQPDSSCDAIAAMMAARLSPASWQPYSSMFGMFVRFCVERELEFLPAGRLTMVMWAQHLAEKGTVKAATAGPYFSVVNTVHGMLGFDKPCVDNDMLASFRKGWERQQVSLQPAPAVAGLALPAALAFKLYLALPGAAAPQVLRQLLFCFLSFVLVLRPASLLSVQWMRVRDGMLQYKPLHWKGRVMCADAAPVLQFPVRHLPFVSSALEKLLSSRYGVGDSIWRLRGEPAPVTSTAESWFAAACRKAGFPPQAGRYTLYSTRRGGASAAAAVGVQLHKIEALGGWCQGSAALRRSYLDHGVEACPRATHFFSPLVRAAVSPAPLFNS